MTTKKKATPKTTGEKTKKKALTEPAATATRASMKAEKPTIKADKVEVEVAVAPAPKVEAPVSPTVAAKAVEPKAIENVIEVVTTTEKPVLTIGMFQKRLHERGYYHGWWDGQYGPMTKHAVARFQADHGLHPDGEPTAKTLSALGL